MFSSAKVKSSLCLALAFWSSLLPASSFQHVGIRPQRRSLSQDTFLPLIPTRGGSEAAYSNHTARYAVAIDQASTSGKEDIGSWLKYQSREGIVALSLPLILLLVRSTKLLPKLNIILGSTAALCDSLLVNYKNSMVVNPLWTKVATGATLAVLGDGMAQMGESKQYDSSRAMSFAAFDSCYRMFQHLAFPFIVRNCEGQVLGSMFSAIPNMILTGKLTQIFATTERTLAYQFGVVPLFYYPVFFAFTGFMQGLTFKETIARARANFMSCWRRNIMFWVPIQMVMFGLIDEKWQVPFVCLVGMIWSSILSVTAGKAKHSK